MSSGTEAAITQAQVEKLIRELIDRDVMSDEGFTSMFKLTASVMSDLDLVSALKVSVSTIGRWKAGTSHPMPNEARTIVRDHVLIFLKGMRAGLAHCTP